MIMPSKEGSNRGTLMTGHLQCLAQKTRPDIIQSIADLEKKGQPAVDYLLLALKDEDKRIRIAAARALGEIGDCRSIEPLIRMLEDKDRDIRFISASILGRIGDFRAFEPLTRACTDENCFVRITAKDSLTKLSFNCRRDNPAFMLEAGERRPGP